MPVNLTLLSHAAPLIVEAANAIFSRIRKNKKEETLKDQVLSQDERISTLYKRQEELYAINEEQSTVIKDLAEQNIKLIQAIRNLRYAVVGAFVFALISILVAVFL